MMREVTFGNRSEAGALNHAVLMSILHTGVLNGVKPLAIFRALTQKTLSSDFVLPKPRLP